MLIETVTSVLVAAATYDLVDLPTAKDELGLSANDAENDPFIRRAISQASAAIATHCKRVFPVETIKDTVYPERDAYPYQVPGGVAPLQLSRWPMQPGPLTLTTSVDAPSGSTLPFASTAGIAVGMPAFGPAGIAADTTVIAFVANTSVTLSAPLTADVPAGSGVTFGPRVQITDPLGTVTDLVLGTDYTIDAKRGWLVRLNRWNGYPTTWDPVMTTVSYAAGYSPVPYDVQDAALRVITARYQGRDRDPYLKSRDQPGLGTETFWVGTLPGVRGTFTEEIEDLLSPYRVPTTA